MNYVWIKKEANWDFLPVFTMKNYEKGGSLSRPFVQLRVCYHKARGLCFRVCAYENPQRYAEFAEYLKNCFKLVWAITGQLHQAEVCLAGINSEGRVEVELISGRDLQGYFWGAQLIVPKEVIVAELGRELKAGDEIAFNLLKYWPVDSKYRHFGRLFGGAELGHNNLLGQEAKAKLIEPQKP